MFRQLRDSLRVSMDAPRIPTTEVRRPRRDRQPRVEGLEQRALCDQGSNTFNNTGSTTTSTISFSG